MGVDNHHNFFRKYLEKWLAEVVPTLYSQLSTHISIENKRDK